MWARWDGYWFVSIAEDGYGVSEGAPAFYPLYPSLLAVVGRALGGHYVLAGVLVSLVACAVAFELLYRLALDRLGDARLARRSVLLVAVFPMSFFLNAVYSEALFLALCVAAFLLAERKPLRMVRRRCRPRAPYTPTRLRPPAGTRRSGLADACTQAERRLARAGTCGLLALPAAAVAASRGSARVRSRGGPLGSEPARARAPGWALGRVTSRLGRRSTADGWIRDELVLVAGRSGRHGRKESRECDVPRGLRRPDAPSPGEDSAPRTGSTVLRAWRFPSRRRPAHNRCSRCRASASCSSPPSLLLRP